MSSIKRRITEHLEIVNNLLTECDTHIDRNSIGSLKDAELIRRIELAVANGMAIKKEVQKWSE